MTAYEIVGRNEITTALGRRRGARPDPVCRAGSRSSLQLSACFARARGWRRPRSSRSSATPARASRALLYEFKQRLAARAGSVLRRTLLGAQAACPVCTLRAHAAAVLRHHRRRHDAARGRKDRAQGPRVRSTSRGDLPFSQPDAGSRRLDADGLAGRRDQARDVPGPRPPRDASERAKSPWC